MTVKHRLILAAALLGCSGLLTASVFAADVVHTRIDAFKASKKSVGAIKGALSGDSLAAIGPEARKLADFATTIPGLFPPGSTGGDTKAKPDIWTHFADFQAKANDYHLAALALAEAADSGNAAATQAKFKAMLGTCKACHERYKEED
jgi:cytochrome c556